MMLDRGKSIILLYSIYINIMKGGAGYNAHKKRYIR